MDLNPGKEADDIIKLVKTIIDAHGARVSGTASNHAAVQDLENVVRNICDTVIRDSFSIHPDSLFSIGKIFATVYLIGLVSLFIQNGIINALGLFAMIVGIIFFVSQFIAYSDIFDTLFKKVTGNNIIGTIEPSNEAKEQIVIVGHHDSSYIYPFHERLPALFPIRLFIPILFFVVETFLLLLKTIGIGFSVVYAYILLFGLIFVIPMFRYISNRPSKGAGDNLIGCSLGMGIMQNFKNERLKNTRLILLLCDGEEIGQKGSRYYVNSHLNDLRGIKTLVINIDSIYRKEDVTLLKNDSNGFVNLSPTMNKDLHAISKSLGHRLLIKQMPFGGGGTDASQFARRNIESASIIGIPMNFIRTEILIHTSKDVPESIDKDAVDYVFQLITEYIKMKDNEINFDELEPFIYHE